MTPTDLTALLERFAQAVASRDTTGFASLFTPDGRYHDGFFGVHDGREAIAAMLDRFYIGGEAFFWQFFDPVAAGDIGYARYSREFAASPRARAHLAARCGKLR